MEDASHDHLPPPRLPPSPAAKSAILPAASEGVGGGVAVGVEGAEVISFSVPLKPMAKVRPRFGGGHAYMPKPYMKWKADFSQAAIAQLQHVKPIDYPCAIAVVFFTSTGNLRPDIDNALGAIMDALQPAVILNDRLVRRIDSVRIVKRTPSQISVEIRKMGEE